MVGPIMSGAVTDAADFTWVLTILAGIGTAMVKYYTCKLILCSRFHLIDKLYHIKYQLH